MIIAIDGFAGCGKSSTAKELAKRLDFIHIDSGAMYRAVTLYFLQNQIQLDDIRIPKILSKIKIDFRTKENRNHLFLNGVDVEKEIRSTEVSNLVSQVSALSEVRKVLVDLQRTLSENNNVVMDGRDIGTVVFPNAEVKLFMTADLEVRAKRRLDDFENLSLSEIKKNLEERDQIDSTRLDSPLEKAPDAIEIDNSNVSFEQQIEYILNLIQNLKKMN